MGSLLLLLNLADRITVEDTAGFLEMVEVEEVGNHLTVEAIHDVERWMVEFVKAVSEIDLVSIGFHRGNKRRADKRGA